MSYVFITEKFLYLIPTIAINIISKHTRKICQHDDNQSSKDGNRANSQNVLFIKYTHTESSV